MDGVGPVVGPGAVLVVLKVPSGVLPERGGGDVEGVPPPDVLLLLVLLPMEVR